MAHLKQQGIHAVFHYVPLHTSPMGRTFGYREGDLPVTEDLSGRLLRLPLYYDITEEEQLAGRRSDHGLRKGPRRPTGPGGPPPHRGGERPGPAWDGGGLARLWIFEDDPR